jgi:hypothetical protein
MDLLDTAFTFYFLTVASLLIRSILFSPFTLVAFSVLPFPVLPFHLPRRATPADHPDLLNLLN